MFCRNFFLKKWLIALYCYKFCIAQNSHTLYNKKEKV